MDPPNLHFTHLENYMSFFAEWDRFYGEKHILGVFRDPPPRPPNEEIFLE